MATQATGAQAQIVIDEETTYGSDPGTPDAFVIPFVNENLQLVQNFVGRQTITSARTERAPRLGKKDVSGGILVELNNHNHAYLLKHLMGTVNTTGTYDHEMKIGDLPIGLVIEKAFTDLDTPEYFKYNGCRINRALFTFPVEGIVTARFDVVGAKETVGTSPLDATPTSDTDEVFDEFDATIEEGGASIATVVAAEIEVINNLDPNGYVYGGAGIRTQLREGMAGVSGKLTAIFDAVTLYNKAVNSTETKLSISLDRDANNAILFEINEMIYEPHAPAIDGPNGITVELPFHAYYDDDAAATSLEITVTNDIISL